MGHFGAAALAPGGPIHLSDKAREDASWSCGKGASGACAHQERRPDAEHTDSADQGRRQRAGSAGRPSAARFFVTQETGFFQKTRLFGASTRRLTGHY